MDSHSKREEFKIFNCNEKNVIAWFLFLHLPPICQLFKIFFGKWSRDISRDLETQNFYSKLLRMMSALFVQKLIQLIILCAKVRESQ